MNRFQSSGQGAAIQQDPAFTAHTFQPDVCSQPVDFPIVAAARVRLTQARNILQFQVGKHRAHYIMRRLTASRHARMV